MPADELQRLDWRKAQHSMSNGACVEVASATENVVIRDSMDPSGPVLRYPAVSWNSFVGMARTGRFDISRLPDGVAGPRRHALPSGMRYARRPHRRLTGSFATVVPVVSCVVLSSPQGVRLSFLMASRCAR